MQTPEENSNHFGDIIVFTMHKSASMFIHQLSAYLSELSGIAHHSPNADTGEVSEHGLLTDKELWRTRHGCFAPVRFYVDIPQIDDYRIILHLRDPRDVLVSMYYSYCYIHYGEIPGNTGYRKHVAEQGIDAFVLTKARETTSSYRGGYGTGGPVQNMTGNIVKKYQDYINNLLGRRNVIFVKYEEMVTDFHSWLERFIKPFPISKKAELVEQLAARSSEFFPRRSNDVMAHTRHIMPGDHSNKLKTSTIEELNEIFGDILLSLGYEKSSQEKSGGSAD